MSSFSEKLFYGKWRTYKVFQNSGGIRLHSLASYIEYDFWNDDTVTIKETKNLRTATLIEKESYSIIFKDKKHFLTIKNGDRPFEIVTINHFALVLLDTVTSEKYFLAKNDQWESIVKNAHKIIL